MTVKVFQIRDQESLYPAVSFTYGMGDIGFKPLDHIEKYEHVADIAGDSLNEAYEYGNIGPETFIKRHKDMHSISVGDILVKDNGETFVVAPSGFDQIDSQFMLSVEEVA